MGGGRGTVDQEQSQARAWWVVGHNRRGGEGFVMDPEHRWIPLPWRLWQKCSPEELVSKVGRGHLPTYAVASVASPLPDWHCIGHRAPLLCWLSWKGRSE